MFDKAVWEDENYLTTLNYMVINYETHLLKILFPFDWRPQIYGLGRDYYLVNTWV